MPAYDKDDIKRRMHGAVEALKHDLGGLRTGRASTALLDPIQVEVYGANMPLNQVATVSAPEPRLLSVQVWDKSNVGPVEKAIRNAGLGINPITDGTHIRLPIPDLTEERRKELAKLAHQYAEKAQVAVRNVRRDGMDALKTDEKKKEISEDEHKRLDAEVQKLTDETIKEIDEVARRQGQGNPAEVSAAPATSRSGDGHRSAPCRHHHGRQRPLGEGARAAARRRPSRRRRGGAARRCARPARRASNALRSTPSPRRTGGGRRPRSPTSPACCASMSSASSTACIAKASG